MNKIKLSILSFGIFFASAAIAQDQKPEMNKEQRIEKRMDQLAQELELTPTQKDQMTALNKQTFESREKVKNDASLDEAGKKQALKLLNKTKKAKMAEILTEEQAAKLKAMKAEKKSKSVQKKQMKKEEINQSPAVR